MSPATARIHRHNLNNPPQAGTSTAAADSGRGQHRARTVITTPAFRALPLFLPVTEEQIATFAVPAASAAKRQKVTGTMSASLARLPSTPPPPSPLVSSRGRHIKLREGSIHLQRREHSANSPVAHAAPQPAADTSASPTPALPPPASVVDTTQTHYASSGDADTVAAPQSVLWSAERRSWVHSWCLWQMRCEYLLGEVRRKLSKREAGRAAQSPHSSGTKKAHNKQSEEEVTPGDDDRPSAAEVRTGEEATEEKQSPSEQKADDEKASPQAEEASGLVRPDESPDTFASLIERIPSSHSQLSLPLLDSLAFLHSVPVPPSSQHLPLLSALATCLLLPLPGPLSTASSPAAQRPFRANYQLRDGQAWKLPEQRIAVEWADAERREEGRREEARGGRSEDSGTSGRKAMGRRARTSRPHVEHKPQISAHAKSTKRDERLTAKSARVPDSEAQNGAHTAREQAVAATKHGLRQQVGRETAAVRRDEWLDEPSADELREANRLSRQQRLAERERREKLREARHPPARPLTPSHRKRHRMDTGDLANPNEIAARAANDLLATLTPL